MPQKRILSIGQCDLDHASIESFLGQHFDVSLERTHGLDDSLAALEHITYDLVLVNRKLDVDGSDGMAVIQAIQKNVKGQSIPVMLVSNYADAQDVAAAAGAIRGFGKAELRDPSVVDRLRELLG